MTIPLGPDASRPPSAPRPPQPDTTIPSPKPTHPMHTTLSAENLGPPATFDVVPPQPAMRRPAFLSRPAPEAAREIPEQDTLSPTFPHLGATATEHVVTAADMPDEPSTFLAAEQPEVATPAHVVDPSAADAVPRETEPAGPSDPPKPPIVPPTGGVGEGNEPGDSEEPEHTPHERMVGLSTLEGTMVDYHPLPPHPARLETAAALQAAKDAGQSITEIILVKHVPENAPRIARETRGCDILELEGYGRWKSEQELRETEQKMTDALSGDPAISTPANLWLGNELRDGDPFIHAILAEMKGSGATVKLPDITSLNPTQRAVIERRDRAISKWDALARIGHNQSATIASTLVEAAEAEAASSVVREAHIAEQINQRRHENPDKDIRLVVGASHYQIAEQLDEDHTHAVVSTPLPNANAISYADEMTDLARRGEPIPDALVDRATLAFMYLSTNGKVMYEDVPSPLELGMSTVDPLVRVEMDDWARTRKFLIDNMSDKEVRETIAQVDRITKWWNPEYVGPLFGYYVPASRIRHIFSGMVARYGTK